MKAKGKPWRMTVRCRRSILGHGFPFLGTPAASLPDHRLPLAIAGLAYLPIAISDLSDAYRLEVLESTAVAPGEVSDLYKSSGRGGPSYHVDYVYAVGAMEVRVRDGQISRESWQNLHGEGTPILVRYLIEDPQVSEPVLTNQNGFAVIHGWMLVACAFFVAGMGYWLALFSKERQLPVKRDRKAATKTKPRWRVARRGGRAVRRS
jgi:hypothetical protein